MVTRETGKQRKSRILPDYFKRPDALTVWKLRLTIALAVLAALWWAGGWLRGGDVGRLRYSRGPLANVHALWDASCSACHLPMTPIDSNSWLASYVGGANASDHQCQSCHGAPKHHKTEHEAETPSCARCHREHRGRDASLVQVSSSECVQCHRDLEKHTQGGQTKFEHAVTGFHTDHPEFKAVEEKSDPGGLHFNHARHLAAGLGLVRSEGSTPADAVKIWKYSDIQDEADRFRYWKQQHPDASTFPADQLDTAVQLGCASCHGQDSGDFDIPGARRHAAGLHATKESTKYMLPIAYERQCQACHPLTFEEGKTKEAVPHGLQVSDVQKYLEGVYVRRFLAGKQPTVPAPSTSRPMPGRIVIADPQAAHDFIDKQVQDAERYLLHSAAGCKRCHGEQDKPLEAIGPIGIRDIWLEHAMFDHAAHRAMDCLLCHEGARQSTTERDVLLPSFKICQNCHAPATRSRSSASGGARFDCTECHRYHNGDSPRQGIGAVARTAAGKAKELSEFLRGSIPHGDWKSSPSP